MAEPPVTRRRASLVVTGSPEWMHQRAPGMEADEVVIDLEDAAVLPSSHRRSAASPCRFC